MRTGSHDDLVALLFAQSKDCKDTRLFFGPRATVVATTLFAAALLDEFISREIGQIIERLDTRFAQSDEHRFGQPFDFGERIFYGVPDVHGRGFKVADDTRGDLFDPTTSDRAASAAAAPPDDPPALRARS